jgi:NTE family protein
MGALVGAAYATGTTVAEMEQITSEISTELLFKEEPPRQVLRRLAKAKGFYRFDELPIPFRAVASDLVTGKPVVSAKANWRT